MNPTAQLYDLATPILASRDFFERSISVLDEADSAFRPREEMMTVAQHVMHAAQTIDWFIDGVTRAEGFDFNFEEQQNALKAVNTLGEARTRFATASARAAEFLRSKTSNDLAKPLPPGPIMGGQPLGNIIWAMVEHTAHHRGALTVYSRLLGKVPAMPYAQ